MLGPVHTYRFHLKTEILLSTSTYRAKMPPPGGGGEYRNFEKRATGH